MQEHDRCLESVPQDAISKCGHLDCHDIRTCAILAGAVGTGTISKNATGRHVAV